MGVVFSTKEVDVAAYACSIALMLPHGLRWVLLIRWAYKKSYLDLLMDLDSLFNTGDVSFGYRFLEMLLPNFYQAFGTIVLVTKSVRTKF